jgi:hypothetical protein
MRRLLLLAGLIPMLAACSPDETSNVVQARSDLDAAGANAADATDRLAAAAEHDASADAANLAASTGNTLENAGADLKNDARQGPHGPN